MTSLDALLFVTKYGLRVTHGTPCLIDHQVTLQDVSPDTGTVTFQLTQWTRLSEGATFLDAVIAAKVLLKL